MPKCNHESDKITKNLSYTDDADWEAWMSYTHKQTLCEKCKRWTIWKWKGVKRKRLSRKFDFTEIYDRDLL